MAMKDKAACIRRACELQHRVSKTIHKHQYATDCFCGWREEQDGYTSEFWRNEGAAFDWLDELADQAIRRHWAKRVLLEKLRDATDNAILWIAKKAGVEIETHWV